MESKLQWQGSYPQRFSGGRFHLKPQDSLSAGLNINEPSNQNNGIKCFEEVRSKEDPQKKIQKTFQKHYKQTTQQIDRKGRKNIQFIPTQKRPRPQLLHINQQQCKSELIPRGIKTFQQSNAPSSNMYSIQEKLQRKSRLLGLDDKRNGLGVTSLGDKSYKYPQYSTNFYKQGGLIVGSTIKNNKTQIPPLQQIKIIPLTKPNWKQKVKLDELAEQKKLLQQVDTWQQTTLKEGNPNWKDPQKFFERQQQNKGPKQIKKAAKK